MARELINEELLPSRTYQAEGGRIINMIDGQEAMRQAIKKALQTPRMSVPWLSKNYGNDLEELIGKSMDYARAEVRRMIVETFAADKRITDVNISSIDIVGKSSLVVQADVSTIYGKVTIAKEVAT